MTSFITTAIPYVNARPHLGFAYELVLADILARHRRRRGGAVRFITGTDENSLKNVTAATGEGIATRTLVDRNAAAFAELGPLLAITSDDFVRTSVDRRHRAAVERLWRACRDDLYRASWEGRYCPGCEAFVDDDVVVCDEHGLAPEPVREENWFFRLARYRDAIRDAIEAGRVQIVPDAARAETLAFLAGPVRDLSVSRVASRSAGWGIGVPDDPTQVIYVWFDALANYLAPGGWETATHRTHVIGKGITRFHAVYWLAFLLAAKLPLPDRIAVHGYLTVDGKKISKSGTGFEVAPVVAAVGADALRWYFARHCRTRVDSDVSISAIRASHDRDLADRLGNLVQRTLKLAPRAAGTDAELAALEAALPVRVDAALDRFAIDEACAAIVELVDAANRYVDRVAPWRLAGDARAAAVAPALHAARVAADELSPIVPTIAARLLDRLENPTVPHAGPPVPRLT